MPSTPTLSSNDFFGRYKFSPRPRTKKHLRYFPFLIILLPAVFLLYLTPYSSTVLKSAATAKLNSKFCDGSTLADPCIFDLGLNAGQSSAVYLTQKRARVIAVEANPILVAAGKERFKTEISDGRMRILHNGLLDPRKQESKELEFWVNKHSKFSSFVERLGCRGAGNKLMPVGDRTNCHRIVVPTASCDKLIEEHGTPQYMKIDIEGMDEACLTAMLRVPKSSRPRYVSVENVERSSLNIMVKLGYTKFKVVNQARIESKYFHDPTMRGNSGFWGDKAVDHYKNEKWHTLDQLKAVMPVPRKTVIDGNVWGTWWDLHAALY